jgi:hypothetical protein
MNLRNGHVRDLRRRVVGGGGMSGIFPVIVTDTVMPDTERP